MSGLSDSNSTDQNDFGIVVVADTNSPSNKLVINLDGSINVLGVDNLFKSVYAEVSSVASASLTTVASYTVPAGKTAFLQKTAFSGSNVAEYQMLVNGTIIDKMRTWFSGPLSDSFVFSLSTRGLPLQTGDIVTLKVVHQRPAVGDFNGRIQVLEV